jgi:predicted ferric reductase
MTALQRPIPVRRWWADAAGSAALLSVIVVLGLWVSNRGIQSADHVTSLGRLAGLLASDLLLLQVLLMARLPWVERAYGQDRLARRHRLIGFLSFWFMVVHVVVITIGYAATAPRAELAPAGVPSHALSGHLGSRLVREAWVLVTTYPGMLLAAAGFIALVVVVALSIRAARRNLRYESWHLIHLYAYLGIGLALPHQIWTGADFIASPLSRLYWWTLYAAALTAVLVFRVGLPLWRTLRHRLEVAAVVPEGPGVVSVYLRGRVLHRLPVRAGQFFLWRFLDGPGWSRAHPYTLSAAPRADLLRITVKDLGDGSGRVAALRPGTKVAIEGPYGAMTADRHRRRKVLLVAAGVGITAIRSLLEDLPFAAGDATVIYRVSEAADAVFTSELEGLAVQRGVRLHYLVGPRGPQGSWQPQSWSFVPDVVGLLHLVPEAAEHEAYVCGPPAWMTAVRESLTEAGLSDDHIHTEEFAW